MLESQMQRVCLSDDFLFYSSAKKYPYLPGYFMEKGNPSLSHKHLNSENRHIKNLKKNIRDKNKNVLVIVPCCQHFCRGLCLLFNRKLLLYD
jgi:hypothetical protein